MDIGEVQVRATRGSGAIDCVFTNFGAEVLEAGTLPLLQPDSPEEGAPSDHRVVFITTELPTVKQIKLSGQSGALSLIHI